MTSLPRNTILTGDATERLHELPTAAVDCVITSPPFFQLRDYRVAGQLGLEPNVDAWVASLQAVLREVARVLKPTGSLWLDVGDSFSRHYRYGAPTKSLLLAPERLLVALSGDGWSVRNKVIWAKPNPMPSSVADRLNLTYDVIYLLVRSRRYFFDLDAIRIPHQSRHVRPASTVDGGVPVWEGPLAGKREGLHRARPYGQPGHALGKNPGDVWVVPTRGYPGAHFATFPEALIERPLVASCPETVCVACGQPWRRRRTVRRHGTVRPTGRRQHVRRYPGRWLTTVEVGELEPCGCDQPTRPGVVLDPFFGTGTVAVVAERHGRDWIGIELNPAYVAMAEARLAESQSAPAAVP